jgi:hypothetical protein
LARRIIARVLLIQLWEDSLSIPQSKFWCDFLPGNWCEFFARVLLFQIWEDSLSIVHAVEPSEAMKKLGIQIEQRWQTEAAAEAAESATESVATGGRADAAEAEEGVIQGESPSLLYFAADP